MRHQDIWTAGERCSYVGLQVSADEARRIVATVDLLSTVLSSVVNRLHNQGGDISPTTHEVNMIVARQAEALLKELYKL